MRCLQGGNHIHVLAPAWQRRFFFIAGAVDNFIIHCSLNTMKRATTVTEQYGGCLVCGSCRPIDFCRRPLINNPLIWRLACFD